MRKAVAQVASKARGNSSKRSRDDNSSAPAQPRASSPPKASRGKESPTATVKSHTKMTPDEAALAAKNYRLAKELVSTGTLIGTAAKNGESEALSIEWLDIWSTDDLLFLLFLQSELRVRHREESKTVTKLTMENVRNLLLRPLFLSICSLS